MHTDKKQEDKMKSARFYISPEALQKGIDAYDRASFLKNLSETYYVNVFPHTFVALWQSYIRTFHKKDSS
jgi:hypothetical protein